MGYYSTLSFEGKAEKINKEALENLNKILQEDKFQGFGDMAVKFDNEGNLEIESSEYCAKFYDSEKFAKELARVIEKGYAVLKFIGEDGEVWGYFIKNGNLEYAEGILLPKRIIENLDLSNLYSCE